jgi:hypothetical protein
MTPGESYKVHWKHWLMHGGSIAIATLINVALDSIIIDQLHQDNKPKIQYVIWGGSTNVVPYYQETNCPSNAQKVRIGMDNEGHLVWQSIK